MAALSRTHASRWYIKLAASTVAALRALKARQAEDRLYVGEYWQDDGFVFTDGIGRPLRANNLTKRLFRALLMRAGLPESTRFHHLRHTAATLLLAHGVHVKAVSEMLGHANVSITLSVYAHVLPTMHCDAVATMERIVTAG